MGPFKGYAVDLVKRTLENTMIYVRDHDCYDYLKKKFDFKNLKESRDLAFWIYHIRMMQVNKKGSNRNLALKPIILL